MGCETGFRRCGIPPGGRLPESVREEFWEALRLGLSPTAAATHTTNIRLGVLVANQILRPPAQLAKQAVTVDHLMCWRFEFGIGAGIFA